MKDSIPSRFLATRGQTFRDPQGRQVLLHGINLVNKTPKTRRLRAEDETQFLKMRQWGFNCVRLGMVWEAIEPQPGQFDETYLREIEQQVAWAKENHLYVLLDMHQDLYSAAFSDGAPDWATLTGGQPHMQESAVWSDAYFTSPAVQAALDAFWNNAAAPDGMGLQDHYAQCWQQVARRFATEPAVIGYDLMNEPFLGQAAQEAQYRMFAAGAEALAAINGGTTPTVEDLAMQWLDPQGRFALLQRLRDPELYARIVDATEPVYAAFEREALMPMYRRIAGAIRAVDSDHILFLETSMGSNMGAFSAIEPLVDAAGVLDHAQAYAPHGYDLVVDTANIAQSSPERVALIFQRHAQTGKRLGLPVLVGEWGAFDGSVPGTLPAAYQVTQQIETGLFSDTYWHYHDALDQQPPFQAICRPYPERAAGTLIRYGYTPEQCRFECEWIEDPSIHAPTRIFLPAWMGRTEVTLYPPEGGFSIQPDSAGNRWLEIPTQGTTRTITIQSQKG